MSFNAADGSINVSVVDGSTFTGLHAADGSVNVVVSDGSVSRGMYHPCGGWWVTVSPGTLVPLRAPDGSLYVSQSGMPSTNFGQPVTVVSGSLSGFTPTSAQSAAFLARATGITTTIDKTNYDTMITGLVNDGVWTKLDALYIFAAPDSTTALLNLVQTSFGGTTHGTVNFSAKHGFIGDGSTFYIDSGFNQGTAPSPQFTLNSASFGVYNLTSNTTENNQVIGNGHISQAILNFQPNFGSASASINGGATASIGTGNSQGFWQGTRTSSSSVSLSHNGGTFTTNASTSFSIDVDQTMLVYTSQTNAGPNAPTTDTFSSAFIGGALTQTNSNNISSRINTFMTAYGINVY